jgi:hypothetical protein
MLPATRTDEALRAWDREPCDLLDTRRVDTDGTGHPDEPEPSLLAQFVDGGRRDGEPRGDLAHGEQARPIARPCRTLQHGCSKRRVKPCERLRWLDWLRLRMLNGYGDLRRLVNA